MRLQRRGGEYLVALLDLFACFCSFAAVALIESQWLDDSFWGPDLSWIPPWAVSALIAWFVVVFPEGRWDVGVRYWVDSYLAVTGTNLLMLCGLYWLFGMPLASWFVIVAGSALCIALTALFRKCIPLAPKSSGKGFLFVGCDDHTPLLPAVMQGRIVGAIGSHLLPVPGVKSLGGPDSIDRVCEEQKPRSIVFSSKPVGVSFRQLLQLHYAGMEVEGAATFYEKVLQRVAWEYLHPSDLLFFSKTSRSMLAFQAIYKNVLGLGLRAICAPLLILISLLIVVFTGGPALEHIECCGYRRTPFQMLRFRTMGLDGNLTRIGGVIAKLHLTNLPQLINIVRGEMTLFGPAPIRTAFVERLSQLLPAYVYRFTVKPGIFGWLDASPVESILPDEKLRLESDLYYIRQESPSLDFIILLRMLLRRSWRQRQTQTNPVAGLS